MLAKRIIPCLDVKDGKVVKGIQFKDHKVMGSITEYAEYYRDTGADELVFYDITASSDGRVVDRSWITKVARILDIPFCVAGGIRTNEDAKIILNSGADKISINSPALENPKLITKLATEFGSQCVVIGIDSYEKQGDYYVYQYTGDPQKSFNTQKRTIDWAIEVQTLGAGEIVLNSMNQDGVKNGYNIKQLARLREVVYVPLIASGGAGKMEHFSNVFKKTNVDGALAASVFHNKNINIKELKHFLKLENIEVRL
ncbi:imidazole glycerol phosphate synthase subunit HisF [Gammaproteobacteria bacterium]